MRFNIRFDIPSINIRYTIYRAAAKSQKGPRKGTYPYRRYNKTQPTFFGALLCPLYEKIGCGEQKLV